LLQEFLVNVIQRMLFDESKGSLQIPVNSLGLKRRYLPDNNYKNKKGSIYGCNWNRDAPHRFFLYESGWKQNRNGCHYPDKDMRKGLKYIGQKYSLAISLLQK